MPTILRINGYRFFFFSLENNEPPHIHIERDDRVAKYWLDNMELASSYGFKSYELTELRSLVIANKKLFLEKWYEFFSR